MAQSLGTVTKRENGGFEGTLATINVNAPIALVPNAMKSSDDAPDVRIIARRNGFELGAGWNRISKQTGEEYLSVKLSAPEFGIIYGNVAPAPGDDPNKKVILWNPPA